MKKYLMAAALAALAASPALAATQHRAMRSNPANGAYDYVAPNADTVVDAGKVLGADPDPAIRTQLLREGDESQLNGGQ
jgi:opacity protein-like surface antigen